MRAQFFGNISLFFLSIVAGSEGDSWSTCPVASFVQFEKRAVLKPNTSKTAACPGAHLGGRCNPEESLENGIGGCCGDTFCSDAGVCESIDYALFKCTWTEKGVLFAESEWCKEGKLTDEFQNNPKLNPKLSAAAENWLMNSQQDELGFMTAMGNLPADMQGAAAMPAMPAMPAIDDVIKAGFRDFLPFNDFTSKTDFAWDCPSVGDPVTDFDHYLLGNVDGEEKGYDLTNADVNEWLEARWSGGKKRSFYDFTSCDLYTLQCTWTDSGLAMYKQKCNSEDPEGMIAEYLNGREDLPVPEGDSLGLCYFTPKTVGEKATYQQLGNKDDKWYKLAEYGFLQCTTPQEAFTSKMRSKIASKRVQCGGLPYNCKTKQAAEDACREWGRVNTELGSGEGELCWKYELGDTVGRNCNPMWVFDSMEGKNHIEGCFESNGNWQQKANADAKGPQTITKLLDKPLSRSYTGSTCAGNLGDVVCYLAPGDNSKELMTKYYQEDEGEEVPEERTAYIGERSYGFDAACCKGHMPNPFRQEAEFGDWMDPDKVPRSDGLELQRIRAIP